MIQDWWNRHGFDLLRRFAAWNSRRFSPLRLAFTFFTGFGAALSLILFAMGASEERERWLNPRGLLALVMALMAVTLTVLFLIHLADLLAKTLDEDPDA